MPDREFIHSASDVASALLYAIDSGLQVMLDSPQTQPIPRVLTRDEAAKTEQGVFYLFRPEWVYGPFHMMDISGGYNKGKYFVQPRTNFAPISISLAESESIKDEKGSGVPGFHLSVIGWKCRRRL